MAMKSGPEEALKTVTETDCLFLYFGTILGPLFRTGGIPVFGPLNQSVLERLFWRSWELLGAWETATRRPRVAQKRPGDGQELPKTGYDRPIQVKERPQEQKTSHERPREDKERLPGLSYAQKTTECHPKDAQDRPRETNVAQELPKQTIGSSKLKAKALPHGRGGSFEWMTLSCKEASGSDCCFVGKQRTHCHHSIHNLLLLLIPLLPPQLFPQPWIPFPCSPFLLSYF